MSESLSKNLLLHAGRAVWAVGHVRRTQLPRLLGYYLELVVGRILGWKREGNLELRLGGFAFVLRRHSGDLGVVCEVLGDQIYREALEYDPLSTGACLDVGANIGCVSLVWSRQRPGARVLALEPHPETFQRLVVNIGNNGASGVSPLPYAAGKADGRIALVVEPNNNMARTVTNKRDAKTDPSLLEVECVALDQLTAREAIGAIDLIKIDVEGAEVECLVGAKNCLSKAKVVVVECHSDELQRECTAILLESGLSIVERSPLVWGFRPEPKRERESEGGR